jgi:mono/diheme cytochrome c family protein
MKGLAPMQPLQLTAALLLCLAIAACGGSPSPGTPSTTPQPAAGPSDPSCPVAVPGTSVTVEDTADGAALVFVTTGDVAEVRRRAAALAQMHDDHHGAMGPLPDGSGGDTGHAGHDMAGHDMGGGEHAGHAGGMIGVHSKATASDVEGGAKVSFVAGSADVARLQSELRMHAQHLATGTCAMGKDPAALAAAETAAYEKARPVFESYCAKCHTKNGMLVTGKKLGHFDMTTYPFGGHHAAEIAGQIRKSLGIDGSKPTMPFDKKGAVQGDELALIAAWADAFDAAHQGAAHEGHGDHAH